MSKTSITNIIIALIITAAAGAVFFFVFQKVMNEGDRLAVQVEALATQRAQEDSFFKLKKVFEETKDDRSELQSFFLVQESGSIDFLNTVESLASKNGVTLKTSGIDLISDKEEGTEWIEFGFTVTGSRDRVQRYIEILENVPYVARLVSVDLKSLSKTEWQTNVKIKVMLLSYDE